MRVDARRLVLSEINVTPLVYVMLVLLVIFMVTTPLLQQGIPVSLPKAGTGESVPSSELVVTLSREHVVYLNGHVVTLQELRRTLASSHRLAVLIQADRNAYVSKLMELWDLCREAGVREIRIATLSR